jgi:hypothetical protein
VYVHTAPLVGARSPRLPATIACSVFVVFVERQRATVPSLLKAFAYPRAPRDPCGGRRNTVRRSALVRHIAGTRRRRLTLSVLVCPVLAGAAACPSSMDMALPDRTRGPQHATDCGSYKQRQAAAARCAVLGCSIAVRSYLLRVRKSCVYV